MCLILLANRVMDDAPLVVCANRDEFYARPASPAQRWEDAPTILAGRDLEAGGTWLAVDTRGRFAAVTNFTELLDGPPPPGTRGALPVDFLKGDLGARAFAARIDGPHYRGFNLLLWDGAELVYFSNRGREARALGAGVHALSNTHFDAPAWKSTTGADGLRALIVPARATTANGITVSIDPLLALLADETVPPDHALPQRGRDIAFERRVAPRFIRGDEYGTRASTVLIVGHDRIRLHERRFGPNGAPLGDVTHDIVRDA